MRGGDGRQNILQPVEIVHQILIQGASTTIADPAQGVLQGAGLVQLLVGTLVAQPIEGRFQHEPVEMRHEERIDRVLDGLVEDDPHAQPSKCATRNASTA